LITSYDLSEFVPPAEPSILRAVPDFGPGQGGNTIIIEGQNLSHVTAVKVGDPAPPLKVEKFLKGDPVKAFKPGHVYVVEFWATWCRPCVASMPHLTELQKFGLLMDAKKYDRAYAIGAKLVAGPIKDEPILLNSVSWSIVDPEAEIEKPDLALAFRAAELAVKLTESKDAAIVDTLARCYWVKGDKSKAVELQTLAVKLCEDDSPMKDSLQKTLDEYKQ
jgi:thiol-disulfide isomerase/thioredoxin